jgi:hypothetical protein
VSRTGGLLLLLAVLAASPSRADPDADPEDGRAPALVSWKRTLCLYTGCFLEPLLPDLRRELGSSSGWVLSWPVHPWATPPLDVPGPTLIVSPFVEPQLRLAPRTLRLLGGARLYAFPDTARWGALMEGAGLWGADGRGGVLGVGLTYDLIERHADTQPWTLSLVYRRTWTNQGPRHDVAFDVTVPIRMFFGTRIRPEDPSDRSVTHGRVNRISGPGSAGSGIPLGRGAYYGVRPLAPGVP